MSIFLTLWYSLRTHGKPDRVILLIQGYDYCAWDEACFLTRHHSALYADNSDPKILQKLNLNWTATYFASQGFPKEKIILGLPAYSHGELLLCQLYYFLSKVRFFVIRLGVAVIFPQWCHDASEVSLNLVLGNMIRSHFKFKGPSKP